MTNCRLGFKCFDGLGWEVELVKCITAESLMNLKLPNAIAERRVITKIGKNG